jgi:ribosomal protein L27
MTKRPGKGTKMSRNFTIHAAKDGVVKFSKRKVRLFSGRSVMRTEVTVE